MNKFQISMKFDFKNGKTYFESLISPSFDELHCSTIVHMNHMEHMFQDLTFYCTKKVTKNHNHFFHFCHGGGTHFLVLAQTLIYCTALLHCTVLSLYLDERRGVHGNTSMRSREFPRAQPEGTPETECWYFLYSPTQVKVQTLSNLLK